MPKQTIIFRDVEFSVEKTLLKEKNQYSTQDQHFLIRNGNLTPLLLENNFNFNLDDNDLVLTLSKRDPYFKLTQFVIHNENILQYKIVISTELKNIIMQYVEK